MIEAAGLSKRYGATVAVDDLSFTVPRGQVTGFLGPNGAGKSTTMRMILGLDAPDSGSVTVNGRPYNEYRRPLFEVGTLLEAKAFHGGRTARNHLLCLALSNGIGRERVDEVLDLVGLRSAARKRAGGFSLGMGQRLGIAAALLGDPPVLMLDEPFNGLDPEGIVWIRGFLRSLAAQGRAVLVSSHLMSELEGAATHLVVMGRGRLVADTSVAELIAQASAGLVNLRTTARAEATTVLATAGATVATIDTDTLTVSGLSTEQIIGRLNANDVPFFEVSAYKASLEQAYMELTREAVEYRAVDSPDGAR